MALANGHKRLSRKARHLIHRLRRTRHASVQDVSLHELKHEINRSWWRKAKPMGRAPQTAPGGYRPPTRRAKQLLTQLRRAKVWRVQQRLVREIAHEIERGKRAVDRAREKAKRLQARAARHGRRARAAGTRFRQAASRSQERLLSRAERKQSERASRGPRQPGRARVLARTAQAKARARFQPRRPASGHAPRAIPVRPVPAPARTQSHSTRPFQAVPVRRVPRARRALRARART